MVAAVILGFWFATVGVGLVASPSTLVAELVADQTFSFCGSAHR